jgi:hypothetical protein
LKPLPGQHRSPPPGGTRRGARRKIHPLTRGREPKIDGVSFWGIRKVTDPKADPADLSDHHINTNLKTNYLIYPSIVDQKIIIHTKILQQLTQTVPDTG